MKRMLMVALIAATAGFGYAQPYGGDFITVTSNGTLWRIDRTGNPTSLADNTSYGDGLAIAYDNQGIYWSEVGNTASTVASAIHEWRNGADTVVFSTTDYAIEELLVNQEGEVVFTGRDVSQNPVVSGVFVWSGGSSVSTITTTAMMGVSNFLMDDGLDSNVITGNYIVGTSANYFDVARDGTTTSLVTMGPFPASGIFSLAQDKRDGVIYKSGFSGYYYIANGMQSSLQTPTAAFPNQPQGVYYGLQMDRASEPDNSRLLYSVYQTTSTLQSAISAVAGPMNSPTVVTTPIPHTVSPGTVYEMVIEGSKNIGSIKTGPGAYTLNFNFPGEGGNLYVSGVTASGFFPGFAVNGLTVCANVDNLLLLSAQGLLAPFYSGGPGALDASGNATGSVNVRADNLGVLVHIVCVTVANGNIQSVSSPYPLKL